MNFKILIHVILLLGFNLVFQARATENLIVSEINGSYKVIGQISGQDLCLTNFADEAIQFAIDQLPKGGVVNLQSGKYFVKKQINLKSFITLTGSGTSSVIRIQPGHDTGIAIQGDSLVKVIISNFSVVASKNDSLALSAIKLSGCGDCLVSDITCMSIKRAGVWFNSSTYLSEIRSCKFLDIEGAGVFLDNLGTGIGGEYLPNLVNSCIAYRCGIGFLLYRAIVANLNGCIAHQCRNAFNLHRSNSICITGGRSFQIEEEAVIVNGSHEINITGNIFCWSVKEAIKVTNVRWGTITGNNLIDVGSINYYTPELNPDKKQHLVFPPLADVKIPLYSALTLDDVKGITITGNALFNWHVCPKMLYGIYEKDNCSSNLITSNNINWVQNEGVKSLGGNTIVANNLTVSDENHLTPHKGVYQVFDVKILDKIIEDMKDYTD